MDAPKRKMKQSCGVANRSNEIDKLRRKKEINARYSRLMLSKTIKHFQKQGHVTICLSEICNGDNDDDKDDKSKMKKSTTKVQFTEPKNRTISFWHFQRALKCEFQLETNSPRVMRSVSVRTQTNFTRTDEELENPCTHFTELSNAKKTLCKTSNEILSSLVSSAGNVMSVVMRSHNHHTNDSERPGENAIAKSAHTLSRQHNSQQNEIRSTNFWASYNNFILCNRSIELRITKLIPLQNVQYIVAFSKDFFDRSAGRILPPKKVYSYETSYVLCFVQFDMDACICEMMFVEHVSDFRMSYYYQENKWIKRLAVSLGDGFSCSILPFNSSNVEPKFTVSSFNGPNRHEKGTMTISILILSFGVLVLLYAQINGSFVE